MTNQSTHPGNQEAPPAQPGVDQAMGDLPHGATPWLHAGAIAKWYGSGLLLAILLIMAVAVAIAMLSPEHLMKFVGPLFERTPSATIAVAPVPGLPTTIPLTSPPTSTASAEKPAPLATTTRPRATSPVPPVPSLDASVAAGVNNESQMLRAMLDEVAGRLGALELHSSEINQAGLVDRLRVLESRLAALIEQPVVTTGMLTDALIETRQAAQAAAQEAARDAAQSVAQNAASHVIQDALQEELQKALASQKTVAPVVAEIEKRLAALEKMAPAVVSITDIDKRVMGLEKMAPAVAAIGDLERRLAGLERTTISGNALADFERRLVGVEKTAGAASQSVVQGESWALGLLNLRLALDRGAPYDDVLHVLRAASAYDVVLSVEVDRLALHAASGVPTLAALRQRLLALPSAESATPDRAAPQVLSSENPPQERGFWAEVGRRLASIVTISRLDANVSSSAAPGQFAKDGATGAIDRAAAHLISDDLTGAVAALDSDLFRRDRLSGPQAMLEDWLRDARARLAADTSFAVLSRRSLSLFSARTDRSPAAAATSGDVLIGP